MSRTIRIIEQSDVKHQKTVQVAEGQFYTPPPIAIFRIGEESYNDAAVVGMYDYSCSTCFPGGFQDDVVPPMHYITSFTEYGFKPGAKLIETIIRVNGNPNLVGYTLSVIHLGDVVEPNSEQVQDPPADDI